MVGFLKRIVAGRRLIAESSPPDASSTASHLEQDFDKLSTGIAADEFYGIPLSSSVDIGNAETETLVCLALLILAILCKPALKLGPAPSLAFWTAIAAAAYAIKEVALYPLVGAVVSTRTSYPWLVVLPHCIVAAASYRKEKTELRGWRNKRRVHYTCSLGMAFFANGFGGSILSDVLMGLPATALGHYRIAPCWLAGWLLVWHSPGDAVYRLLAENKTFASYFLNACEAVDGVTTPMGRVSRSARELNNKGLAPVLAGTLAGCGGAVLRYADRVLLWGGGGEEDDCGDRKGWRDAIEDCAWKNLWYSALWWYLAVYRCRVGEYDGGVDSFEIHHCNEFGGSDLHRFVMVMAHVAWWFGCSLGLLSGHPFLFASRHLRNGLSALANALQPGPPAETANNDGQIKMEKLE